jgi:DnaJ-class molecular chaperone
MEKLSWPVCDGCEGYGTVLLNQVTHQRSNDPCPKCGGGGRMAPPDVVKESETTKEPEHDITHDVQSP